MRKKIQDHYAIRAKKEGYLARSVYKLEEIDAKYSIISPGKHILDIGAAPGSWTQYCLKKIGKYGFITAVDLHSLKTSIPDGRGIFIKGDFFSPEYQEAIAHHGPYDSIISDAAPATTGNRTVDTGRSYTLVSDIIANINHLINENGSVVFKLFQGGDEQQLMEQLKEFCRTVKLFKPKASRSESFEIFLVGKQWRTS